MMTRMKRLATFPTLLFIALTLATPAGAADKLAEKLSAPELIALAQSHSAGLRAGVLATFDEKQLKDGTAWAGRGSEFFFAVEAATAPMLLIDDGVGTPMEQCGGTDLWCAPAHIEAVGHMHQFHYVIDGASFGGRLDMPAFGPLSYLQPGTPSGTLSEKLIHTSKIYDGMKSEYWIYVPAQYDPKVPAAVMVFQDGGGYIGRDGNNPALNVIDNLIAQKKIPVMICVFINPGDISGSPGTPTYDFVKGYSDKWSRTLKDSMRSTLYDTVSDRYARFLRDEVLAEVGAKYNLRKDAYSHAITGGSSGGICSLNAAWQMPDEFSRVVSWIGSFTSIQWKENPANADGGQDYPEKVLREGRRNIRVWLQDGANDMENDRYGSWPTANIRMANALKAKGYDFHFSFGKGTHNSAQGATEFPQTMVWLWRDYAPAKTESAFNQDAAEKEKPYFRVAALNRGGDE
jgi:enterochelin esterase family protein